MKKCEVNKPTKHAKTLNDALHQVGIETILEYSDGHKCIDIFVPKAKLYIEIDGMNHYTSAFQMTTDFNRDHYSDDDGFHTLRIPNVIVDTEVMKIARAIKKMVNF